MLQFVIGDLVQQSITQDDRSVTGAVLAISTIALLIVVQSYAVFRWRRTRPVLEGRPVMLIHDGVVIADPLRRERMTVEDLEEAARAQGIDRLGDIRVGILETDGKLSFITVGAQRHEQQERRAE